jgi:hypothetical protein
MAFMMGRYSSQTDLRESLTSKQIPDGTKRVKKKALKKENTLAYKITFANYLKKKKKSYSIVYEACAKNATTSITRSAYIKNCRSRRPILLQLDSWQRWKQSIRSKIIWNCLRLRLPTTPCKVESRRVSRRWMRELTSCLYTAALHVGDWDVSLATL